MREQRLQGSGGSQAEGGAAGTQVQVFSWFVSSSGGSSKQMNPGGADPKQEQAGHRNSCGGTRPRAVEEPALGTDKEEEHVLKGLSRESPNHAPPAVKGEPRTRLGTDVAQQTEPDRQPGPRRSLGRGAFSPLFFNWSMIALQCCVMSFLLHNRESALSIYIIYMYIPPPSHPHPRLFILKPGKSCNFAGGPLVKTPRTQCRGPGFNLWSGN